MTENQRLKIIMTALGFKNQAQFASALEISAGGVSDILREKPGVGVSDKIKRKLEHSYKVNIEWLENGIGEMMTGGVHPKLEAKPIRLADPEGFEATGDRFYELPDQTIIMQTPVIPVKAYGSYLRGHSDPEFYEGLETMPVPVDIKHKGTYLIWEVGGESMVNPGSRRSIWPGEKIIGRDLRKDHWKYKLHINSNDCWIIVHKYEGIVIKEITDHNIDTGEITLHSWNPDKVEYPDYIVSLNDVEQIFNVVDPFNKFG